MESVEIFLYKENFNLTSEPRAGFSYTTQFSFLLRLLESILVKVVQY